MRRAVVAVLAFSSFACGEETTGSTTSSSSSQSTTSSSSAGGAGTGGGTGGSGAACPGFGPGVTTDADLSVGLTAADEVALTGHLDTLSTGWVQASVNGANDIMTRPEYDAVELRAFFERYFVVDRKPLTDDLWGYLGYPAFYWFDTPENTKLQRALVGAMRKRVELELDEHAPTLGADLEADVDLRQTLFNASRVMTLLRRDGVLDATERRDVFDWYAGLVAAHPDALRADHAIDPAAEPWVPALRAQMLMGLTDAIELDACDAENVATRLGLSGDRLDLWSDTGVLLHDNLAFGATEVRWVHDVLAGIPPELHDLGHITQHERLGNAPPSQEPLRSFRAVNVFDVAVGAVPENPFPADVSAVDSDIFVSVLSHEANHIVDAHYIELDPTLKARKQALIARAGLVDLQYLRSMVGGTFFQGAPQEFVASISNQWFTDSVHTVELGLSRFDQGYAEPLNQVLFMLEVYSRGGLTTRFYRAHFGDAAFDVQDVTVTRDASGRIDGVSAGGSSYTFSLDAEGFVTDYATP